MFSIDEFCETHFKHDRTPQEKRLLDLMEQRHMEMSECEACYWLDIPDAFHIASRDGQKARLCSKCWTEYNNKLNNYNSDNSSTCEDLLDV